jgi:hypothetical protein
MEMMEKTHDILDALLADVVAQETIRGPVPTHEPSGLSDHELALVVDRGVAGLSETARTRLAGCAHCLHLAEVTAEAIAEWEEEDQRRIVAAEEDEAQIGPKRVKAVLQWAADGLRFICGSVTPQPLKMQPVAVRDSSVDLTRQSEPPFREFRAMLGPDEIRLQVERLPSELMDLQVQVVQRGGGQKPFRATLLRRGRVSQSVPFESGLASFRDLRPESYILQVTSQQDVVGWIDLMLLN